MEKLKWLPKSAIDPQLWEECIGRSEAQNHLYSQFWYLNHCTSNWGAIVLLDAHQNYQFALPVAYRKKFGLKYVYTPFFIQKLSVLGNYQAEDVAAILRFLLKKFKHVHLMLNAYSADQNLQKYFLKRNNYELPLKESYSELYAKYSKNHKRNLKKVKGELTLGNTIEPAIELFKRSGRSKQAGYQEADYQNLIKCAEELQKQQQLLVYNLTIDGEICCVAVFFIWQNYLTFIFSGNSFLGKQNNALLNILNHVIKEYSNSDYILDFEGSNQEGLARFYSAFGANSVPYYFFKKSLISRV